MFIIQNKIIVSEKNFEFKIKDNIDAIPKGITTLSQVTEK